MSQSKWLHCFWSLRQGTPISLKKMERDKDVGILYLDEEERKQYELYIKNGDFSYENTALDATHHLLFGLDNNNAFYGKLGFEWKDYGRGYFGHGSFKGGGYLKAAGELIIINGKLRYITSNSGHYLPKNRHMRMALYQLLKRGVDLSEVTLILYNHPNSSPPSRGRYKTATLYNAMEFLEKHENDCKKYDYLADTAKNVIQSVRNHTNENICLTTSPENTKPHRLAF